MIQDLWQNHGQPTLNEIAQRIQTGRRKKWRRRRTGKPQLRCKKSARERDHCRLECSPAECTFCAGSTLRYAVYIIHSHAHTHTSCECESQQDKPARYMQRESSTWWRTPSHPCIHLFVNHIRPSHHVALSICVLRCLYLVCLRCCCCHNRPVISPSSNAYEEHWRLFYPAISFVVS